MNYTTLVQNLQNWMEDDGLEFAGSIEQLVAIAHRRVCRDLDLALFVGSGSSNTANGNPVLTKPSVTGIIAFSTLRYTNAGRQTILSQRSLDYVLDYAGNSTGGPPLYYADLSETQWTLAPVPAATHAVTCTGSIDPPPLSTTVATTWLGDALPDLLFKACKQEAEGFLKADDRIQIWTQQYAEALPIAKRYLYDLLRARYQLTPMQVPAQPTIAR